MDMGKAVGLNESMTNFFHYFWDLIKQEVWEIVQETRRAREILKDFNATFFSLVPKVEGADSLRKFRPKSLCNVIYKVISNVIANRVKLILPKLISPK